MAFDSTGSNGITDVYHVDLNDVSTILLSMDSWYKARGDANSVAPSISADGLSTVFASFAYNLVPYDSNYVENVDLHVWDPNALQCFVAILSVAIGSSTKTRDAGKIQTQPYVGETVYRVFGGPHSAEFGFYWTPVDPQPYGPDLFRYVAGLPDRVNAGDMLVVGTLNSLAGVVGPTPSMEVGPETAYGDQPFTLQSGAAYRTYPGGLAEYQIPNADVQVAPAPGSPSSLSPPYGGPPYRCGYAPRGCYGE